MRRPTRSTRTAAALLLTVAATLIAAPVGAVEVLDTSGDPGTYTIRDTVSRPSVRCRFEDAVAHLDEQLDRVSARPLKVRGIRAIRTWVGYRFSVLQRPALEPDYAFVHKGAVLKRKANLSEPARFPRHRWAPPEDLAASDFRVVVDLFWYRPGSKHLVRGKVRAVLEVYRHTHPSEAGFTIGQPGAGGECFYDYWT